MCGAFVQGLLLGLSLIVAIGAQNAFVLRQGLRGQHIFAVCLTCAVSDALLILAGVSGFQVIIAAYPQAIQLARWGGAAFLLVYGGRCLLSAYRGGGSLEVVEAEGGKFIPVIMTCLALTWLNPHVYLDTVVLIGSVSMGFIGAEASFALGAMSASFLFFFSLGYGAAALRPVFATARSWQVLDSSMAIVMWSLCALLLIAD